MAIAIPAALISAAKAIGSIAAWVGVERLISKWDNDNIKNLNLPELIADYSTLIDAAQQKGSNILNRVVNRLNAIPIISGSDIIRDKLRSYRRKLNNIQSSVEEALSSDEMKDNIKRSKELGEINLKEDYLKDKNRINEIKNQNTMGNIYTRLENIEKEINN